MIARNIVECLRANAVSTPQKVAFNFLGDGENVSSSLTYAELDQKTDAIASWLIDNGFYNQRALLLFPSSIEFMLAFFACLKAGVVAIPANQLGNFRNLDRLNAIISNAEPSIILSIKKYKDGVDKNESICSKISSLSWLSIDEFNCSELEGIPASHKNDLAFIQYTSGSTGSPKGVMISHNNISENCEMTGSAFEVKSESVCCAWLPLFHDMGLFGSALLPIYSGATSVFMPPACFLQKPIRWFSALSTYKATHTAAANFSFDLCSQAINPGDIDGLDLSNLKMILTGGEPVSPDSVDKFIECFNAIGIGHSKIYPAYGMAETGVFITGGKVGESASRLRLDTVELGQHKIKECEKGKCLVSNGWPRGDGKVVIVDPNTNKELENDSIGEVWVHGPHVAEGYWKNEDQTLSTFRAKIDGQDKSYLRTGDFGFIQDNELYITGRMKDIVIVRGRNHYPQDIEATVNCSSIDLRDNACAAFSIEKDGTEALVVVQEIKRSAIKNIDIISTEKKIRKQLALRHELTPVDIVLLKPMQLPLTSSGKVQRQQCKALYLTDSLKRFNTPLHSEKNRSDDDFESLGRFVTLIAEQLKIPQSSINPNDNLFDLGLDSLAAAQLQNTVLQSFNKIITLEDIWDSTDIASLASIIDLKPAQNQFPSKNPLSGQSQDIRYVIEKTDHTQAFSLTPVQQAYWLGRGDQFHLGNTSCHYYCEFDVVDLDVERLESALNQLIKLHGMLRAIVTESGQQKVLESVADYRININDASNDTSIPDQVRQSLSHEIFDTNQWPLFRVEVTPLANQETRIHFGIDLIIADVSSLFVLMNQWERLYKSDTPTILVPKFSFQDCLAFEQKTSKINRDQAKNYWSTRIESFPKGPALPTKVSIESIAKPVFTRRDIRIQKEQWKAIKAIAKKSRLTPSMVLCTLFSNVLQKWTQQSHFSLNMTIFNRPQQVPGVFDIVGDFTALSLLEVRLEDQRSFVENCSALQQQVIRDLDHCAYSGVEVLRDIARAKKDESLFAPVVFTSALSDFEADETLQMFCKPIYAISQTPQVAFDHQAIEVNGELRIAWDTVEALFDSAMLDDMAAAYEHAIKQLGEADNWHHAVIIPLPDHQLDCRAEYNMTAAPIPKGLLHDGFVKQATVTPDKTAVITPTQALDYCTLYQYSHAIATKIISLGINRNEHVAIVMEKEWQQVAAVLGVSQSGAAYLPIDATYPCARIQQLLELGEVKLILTQAQYIEKISGLTSVKCIVVDDITVDDVADFDDKSPTATIPNSTSQTDLAYTIFTSGSTGTPKGVMIDHRGALNTVVDVNQRFELRSDDCIFGISNLNFDLSVWDIFGPLSLGATLVLPAECDKLTPDNWLQQCDQHRVTVWNSVPALAQLLFQAGTPEHMRLVMMSGDRIPVDLPTQIQNQAPQCHVHSMGGATEASIWSIHYPINRVDSAWSSIPYGRPMKNQRFYVLDTQLHPSPDWVAGDLFIGGTGLAKAYWKDESKTRSSFIRHPITGERLYKTGDLGRMLPCGNIEFLGRADFQVKVQGHRIELGEIEANLNQISNVRDSLANVIELNGRPLLVAYVISSEHLDTDKIREVLGEQLPYYMVPNAIEVLTQFPLTANGKVDRKALPAPSVNKAASCKSAIVKTPIQNTLTQIWESLLNTQDIDIDDNFFQLGGDSILAIQMVNRLKNEGYELKIKKIFESQTIKALAEQIAEKPSCSTDINPQADYPLTPIQQWFMDNEFLDPGYWCQTMAFEVKALFDTDILQESLQVLVKKHPVLTTSFKQIDGHEWRQTLNAENLITLQKRSLQNPAQLEALLQTEQKAFKLNNGPLFKVVWLEISGQNPLLLLLAHHLIMDGVSARILLDDWLSLYRKLESGSFEEGSPELSVEPDYGFLAWSEYLNTAEVRREFSQDFWKTGFDTDTVWLPSDWLSRGSHSTLENATLLKLNIALENISLPDDLDQKILASVAGAIMAQTEQSLIVDIESYGRPLLDNAPNTQFSVGWFTSVYPLLLKHGDNALSEQLAMSQDGITDLGIGFGLAGKNSLPENCFKAGLSFNYLGNIEHSMPKELGWHSISPMLMRSPGNHCSVPVECIAHIESGCIHLQLIVSQSALAELDSKELEHAISDNLKRELFEVGPSCDLTGSQEGILLTTLRDATNDAYSELISFELDESLDVAAFKNAWQVLIDNEPTFRTTIRHKEQAIPSQQVLAQVAVNFLEVNESDISHNVVDWLESNRCQAFDFENQPAMRFSLISLRNGRYRFSWNFHHSLIDGWSLPLILNQLMQNYRRLAEGQLPERRSGFNMARYVRWIKQQDKHVAVEYWHRELARLEGPCMVPTSVSLLDNDTRYAHLDWELDRQLSQQIKQFCKDSMITVNTFMQGLWSLYLSRSLHNATIGFGVAVSGRQGAIDGIETAIGMFINTVPLVATIDENCVPSEWLQTLLKEQVNSRNYEWLPLAEIQQQADSFNTLLVFENYPVNDLFNGKGLPITIENMITVQKTHYPLTLIVTQGETIDVKLAYQADKINPAFVQEIVQQLAQITEAMLSAQSMSQCQLLSENQQRDLLRRACVKTDRAVEYRTLHEAFELQVKRVPEKSALIFDHETVTYTQLNAQANRLAHCLIAQGVSTGEPVGLGCQRGQNLAIALLAILKAGAGYVTLDPNNPDQRLRYLVDNAQLKHLITDFSRFDDIHSNVTRVDRLNLEGYSDLNPEVLAAEGDLAYVTYTSGSTGKPKGVAIPHNTVINLLDWQQRSIPIADGDRVLQFASINFDASVQELFSAWANGVPAVMATHDQRYDFEALTQLLFDQHVTHVLIPVVLCQQIATICIEQQRFPTDLKVVVTHGEQLQITSEIREFFKTLPQCELHNHYGPSEAHVVSSYPMIGNADAWPELPPIGRAVDNCQLIILDKNLHVVPNGVEGELYIGGDCLAIGYLNQPELTEKQFLNVSLLDGKRHRLYKTGDMAVCQQDGNIQLRGRYDSQVKIRGHRVEPNEIEFLVAKLSLVEKSTVKIFDHHNEKSIAVFVQTYDRESGNADRHNKIRKSIKRELKKSLPDYMQPRWIAFIDDIPLNQSGKIDRSQLAKPEDLIDSEKSSRQLMGDTENFLANIWCELLNRDKVCPEDNFFSLGGHSLKAAQVVARMRARLKQDFPIHIIFENPVLADLAIEMENHQKTQNLEIHKRESDKHIPLSNTQQRLWLVDQLEGHSSNYNIPIGLHLKGRLESHKLRDAFAVMVERHGILRTRYGVSELEPIQLIAPTALAEPLNIKALADGTDINLEIERHAKQRFDLSKGPLWNATLFEVSNEEYYLLLNFHHSIADAWSIGLFAEELSQRYSAIQTAAIQTIEEIPTNAVEFADFSIWQGDYLSNEKVESQLGYWKTQLIDVPNLLEMPTDFPRPVEQSFNGRSIDFSISNELVSQVDTLASELKSTRYAVLMAAFNILLARYSDEKDIVVGTAVANRPVAQTENMLGVFANTLAIRTQLSESQTISDIIKRLTHTSQQAFANQDVPFDSVVDALGIKRSLSVSPLIQAMFILQNTPMHDLQLEGVELNLLPHQSHTTKLDINLSLFESKNGLQGYLEYATDLFEEARMQRMVGHYVTLLKNMCVDKDIAYEMIDYMTEQERQELVFSFNNTEVDYPAKQCIHQLFEEQVAITPDSIALVFEGQHWSYRELNRRANQLANYLVVNGADYNVMVAVSVNRSANMLISFLAVMKANAVYVPIDPSYPVERIAHMLNTADARILLTESSITNDLSTVSAHKIDIDSDWLAISEQDEQNLQPPADNKHLAYMLFTSGSTGEPKGILVSQQAFRNVAATHEALQASNEMTVVLQFVSLSFSVSLWNSLMGILKGGKVIQVNDEQALPGSDLVKLIHDQSITHATLPVSVLSALGSEAFPYLGFIISTAEACTKEIVQQWSPNRRFINGYGPTEISIGATLSPCTNPGVVPPIGRPMPNTQVYLLDKNKQIVPKGIPGELHVGGVSLAEGYLGLAEKTAEAFIVNPVPGTPSERLYNTSDLASYNSAGDLMFVGRKDLQVKIRGFRVELGEIESVIRRQESIKDVSVVVQTPAKSSENNINSVSDDKKIVAFVVLDENPEEPARPKEIRDNLRNSLNSALPDFMAPSHIIIRDSLPLTPNRKVDRKALEKTVISLDQKADSNTVLPNTEIERTVSKIWEKHLDRKNIGIHDDFFTIGGHSLLAIKVLKEIEILCGVRLPVTTLFRNPTIAETAKAIDDKNSSESGNNGERLLLLLKEGEEGKTPIVLIHPIDGSLLCYQHLVNKLDGDSPIYGIQSHSNAGLTQPSLNTMEELAAYYCEELHREFSGRPIHLIGWSFGGLLSFEMAKQLQGTPVEVASLTLLDSQWSTADSIGDNQTLEQLATAEMGLSPDENLDLPALAKLALEQGRIQALPDLDSLQWSAENIQKFAQLASRYQPSGELEALNILFTQATGLDSLWASLTRTLNKYPVRGDHFSMMDIVNSGDIAKKIQECINIEFISSQSVA